jgi:phosphonate ABC transporter permease subunit PhnE
MKDITSSVTSVALSLLAIPAGVVLGASIAHWLAAISQLLNKYILVSFIGLILLPILAWQLVCWALPQEEINKPSMSLRLGRLLALIIAALSLFLSFYLLSNLMIQLGDALASHLGAFAFLGTFIADLGDILGMIMVVILALIGAGVLSSLTGRLGQWIARDLPPKTGKIISLPLSALAGATLAVILGAGIDWLYQINDPLKMLWLPAGVGAVIGLALAIKLSLQNTLPTGLVIYYLARTIFNALRSIEALIMVIVFVVWVGIGPFAGVLALSLHTVAALAKLYSEQVESILPGPIEAVRATGATRLQTIIYAVIPQIIPPYISFTMYRWDINVRMSTIIGFAGGGGIGFLLMQNINLLNYRAASAQMLAIAIVVASMDYVSSKLREMTI